MEEYLKQQLRERLIVRNQLVAEPNSESLKKKFEQLTESITLFKAVAEFNRKVSDFVRLHPLTLYEWWDAFYRPQTTETLSETMRSIRDQKLRLEAYQANIFEKLESYQKENQRFPDYQLLQDFIKEAGVFERMLTEEFTISTRPASAAATSYPAIEATTFADSLVSYVDAIRNDPSSSVSVIATRPQSRYHWQIEESRLKMVLRDVRFTGAIALAALQGNPLTQLGERDEDTLTAVGAYAQAVELSCTVIMSAVLSAKLVYDSTTSVLGPLLKWYTEKAYIVYGFIFFSRYIGEHVEFADVAVLTALFARALVRAEKAPKLRDTSYKLLYYTSMAGMLAAVSRVGGIGDSARKFSRYVLPDRFMQLPIGNQFLLALVAPLDLAAMLPFDVVYTPEAVKAVQAFTPEEKKFSEEVHYLIEKVGYDPFAAIQQVCRRFDPTSPCPQVFEPIRIGVTPLAKLGKRSFRDAGRAFFFVFDSILDSSGNIRQEIPRGESNPMIRLVTRYTDLPVLERLYYGTRDEIALLGSNLPGQRAFENTSVLALSLIFAHLFSDTKNDRAKWFFGTAFILLATSWVTSAMTAITSPFSFLLPAARAQFTLLHSAIHRRLYAT